MISTKEEILNVASRLIGVKGFDSVSIREITKEVGIKESSFYNHFKSKESLLDEIFALIESNLNNLKPDDEELMEMCRKMNLKEFLKFRLDQFIQGWNRPEAKYLWYVVSQQQYKNRKAAELIVRESEKAIEMFTKAFQCFMACNKMKKEDPFLTARLYGFSIRSLHLDCTYRSFMINEKADFSIMYETMEKFAEQYMI